ncbi:MAG: stage II sporulation protein R [Firmicutes bacterium]|nr:stage II sporulation protein R [Bacillota bacterium]
MMVRTLLNRVLISTIILAVALVFGLLGAYINDNVQSCEEAYNAESLIRLHILANSDAVKDQELKLLVRDAVLGKTQEIFAGSTNKAEAWQKLLNHEDAFEIAARDVVKKAGFDYPVKINLVQEPFPERTYGVLTIPAGDYHAMQVVIGDGVGRNWWCVLFPPLCLMDALETESVVRQPQDQSERKKMVEWRLRYLDGIYREYGSKMASVFKQGFALRFLSTAQLPIWARLPK